MRKNDMRRFGVTIGDSMDCGAYTWDANSDAFRMDPTLCRFLGMPNAVGADGISLRQVVELIHRADGVKFSSAITSSARAGSPFRHSFRARVSDAYDEKLQAVGYSFSGSGGTPGVSTGLVFRIARDVGFAETELTDHCIAAYEYARRTNSTMVQYLISMALIELGHQIAGFEQRRLQ
ncbi:hypothetical protein AAIH70_16215 [Neorhizobium sp. BT27B]|uniref:hypothetical protein n=1 Tax=Neorhizobium sp. BT27B TaxID=3142625 RepID=UPI003D26E8E1